MIDVYLQGERLILVPDECEFFKSNKAVAATIHGDDSWFCNEWQIDRVEEEEKVCTLPELVEALKAIQESKRRYI